MLDALAVVLVSPRNPVNIGAVARAMSNFGCVDLRLVMPYRVAFDEARAAVNAGHVLAQAREFATIPDAVADCSLIVGTSSVAARGLAQPVWRLEAAARRIKTHLKAGRAALLFGSEKFGLSSDDLAHCHWRLRIPARAEHGSMNLGQAVAVCLYELIRDGRRAQAERPRVEPAAAALELDRLTVLLEEVCTESGYLKPPVDASVRRKLRRLVRRWELRGADAPIWQGVFRQILWAVRARRPDREG
jgi:tRNA/rRNA methyltransferase